LLISLDGMVPIQMVGVSAFVIFPCTTKVQKISSDTGSFRWCQKKGHKTVVCACACCST